LKLNDISYENHPNHKKEGLEMEDQQAKRSSDAANHPDGGSSGGEVKIS
jgi:hypothetical protein